MLFKLDGLHNYSIFENAFINPLSFSFLIKRGEKSSKSRNFCDHRTSQTSHEHTEPLGYILEAEGALPLHPAPYSNS